MQPPQQQVSPVQSARIPPGIWWRAIFALVMLVAFGIMLLRQPSPPTPEPLEFSGSTMGTTYSIRLTTLPEELTLPEIQQQVDEILATVNRQMSTYDPESELSRFNASQSTDWFLVSADTARVVALSQQISASSAGAFDVTVGPLVNLWSFGPGNVPERVPSDDELTAARSVVGHERLEVRIDPPAIRKSVPGLAADLSAVAKGYGVDVVAERLIDLGATDFLVEIGGEIRTRGARPDGRPWQVGIEAPDPQARVVSRVIPLSDASLATSGSYRNYFEVDGVPYSHTIDPATGKPVTHLLVSVSVIATDCATADALATTLMVLGPEAGYNWAVEQGIAAWFLSGRKDALTARATPRFDELVGTKP